MNEEQVMTDFLLGALDPEAHDRVSDRLAADEDFFERMAACEDDLILRWHRGTLSPSQRELFGRAYAAPARRARVDAADKLLAAAELSRMEGGSGARSSHTTIAVAAMALAAMLVLAVVTVRRDQSPSSAVVAVMLTAVGEKGPAARGGDRVELPKNATAVELTVPLADITAGLALTAEIVAVDGGASAVVAPVIVQASPAGPVASVTVPTRRLPNGDYVLTIRQGPTNNGEVLSMQPFRVTRRS